MHTLGILWPLIFTYMAYFVKISWSWVAAFKICGHFLIDYSSKNQNIIVKTLENGICYKVESLASFLLKF